MKKVLPVRFGYFPADKSISVLFAIEIIQRFLEVESPPPVASKAGDESRIPHEQVAIEGRIAIVGDKTVFGGGLFQVAESQLPGAPVAGDMRGRGSPRTALAGRPAPEGTVGISVAVLALSKRSGYPGPRRSGRAYRNVS